MAVLIILNLNLAIIWRFLIRNIGTTVKRSILRQQYKYVRSKPFQIKVTNHQYLESRPFLSFSINLNQHLFRWLWLFMFNLFFQLKELACSLTAVVSESYAGETAIANQVWFVPNRSRPELPPEYADHQCDKTNNIPNLATCPANATYPGDCAASCRGVIDKHHARYFIKIDDD